MGSYTRASPSPQDVFLEACDIYFLHSHNKPYSLFNPDLLQRKIEQGQVPQYLQFAVIATAVRFSSHIQWKERKQKTIDSYAQCSWAMIMSSPDGLGDSSDVSVIQALTLLAVIDATAGRRRPAWVKIGMAVRISQDLQMMLEPDNQLSAAERDERRNLFWSLFILDRFVCCSFRRPPAIKDSDCRLNLPVDNDPESSITLSQLLDEKVRGVPGETVGLFGLSVGFAALLGRTIDYMMNGEPNTVEPWRRHSDYSIIYAGLELLKELAAKYGLTPTGACSPDKTQHQSERDQRGHLFLCHTLYHLTHCILSHPFLLGVKGHTFQHLIIPRAWMQAQYNSCWDHACSLTTLIVEAKAAGYILAPSFCSYCILVAGTLHALHLHSGDAPTSQNASDHLKTSLDYLGEIAEMWQNSYIMAGALRFFTNRCVQYSGVLLLSCPSRIQELSPTDMTVLRSVLDYWIMMDPRNPVSEMSSINVDCFPETVEMRRSDRVSIPWGLDDTIRNTSSAKGNDSNSINPSLLMQMPLSTPPSIPLHGENFSQWNWKRELGSLGD
ncbi:hypothetical protein P175DRAFT_0527619 [Aspergillus ochraceoroseus IBT 24754]|uniref:Xylanolytic transcriptional activator regulatory domain-containing protein n=2 Tax=Aspergillus ochraceoroseus TaxID=138278 RepID=A0A2T5M6K6_9EURO|nr:uncharacterized protein P175DRAFT_0527619 [Aspergillus ochraceoroseus IBT 24754]PTU24164.1 hypothetical protein P175DRAFT_0527619 [Aspergillus ochraceoroseus IBT 24754]